MRKLHLDELKDLSSGTPGRYLENCINDLNQGFEDYEVNTPLRMAHFLTQLLFFTNGLTFSRSGQFGTLQNFFDFWVEGDCNQLSDRDDLDGIIDVFVSDVGIAERVSYWNHAIAILRE